MSEQRQSQQRGQQSPLRSDRGRSTIENAAVSKIAGVAAQKVEKSRWEAVPPRPSAAS